MGCKRIGIAGFVLLCAAGVWGLLAAGSADQAPPESYTRLVESFKAGEVSDIYTLVRAARRDSGKLTAAQRRDIAYINREWRKVYPEWWKDVSSLKPVSFKAEMWGKKFPANYVPSDQLGLQQAVDIDRTTNRLVVTVTWRPQYVGSAKPLEGWLAEKHGITHGTLAEVIAWHELGHNYVTLHLPVESALELYIKHNHLFHHVQEFYADMTALRHCSPNAARTSFMFRLRELNAYNPLQPHTRAAHGIGAILLVEWLTHPDQWPMVRFPPAVPDERVELQTIMYCYENLEPEWDLTQYARLRGHVERWMRTGRKGDLVLKNKGRVKLDNRLEMKLMAADDKPWQAKRDAWVAKRLRALIDSGRADKQAPKRPKGALQGAAWNGIVVPFEVR